ncbi:MAG: hypothetical protein AB9922_05795 [Bacteroidales bacterium]
MSKNHLIQAFIISVILSAIFQTSAYGQEAKRNFRTETAVASRVILGGNGIGGDISFEVGGISKEAFHFGAGIGGGYNVMAGYGGTIKDFTLPVYAYTGYNIPLSNKRSFIARVDGGYHFREERSESTFFVNPQIGLLFISKKRSSKPFLLIGYRKECREYGYGSLSLRFGFRF